MTIEEALKTAIEFEKKVTQSYRDSVGKLKIPEARRVFETLAKEEEGHVKYLESRLAEWQASGHVTPERLDTVVPNRAVIERNVARLEASIESRREASSEEVRLLQNTLDAELNASAFYRRLVGTLDAEEKKLFERFMEIEDGHVSIVQAELDSVKGLGYWFDFQEWQFQDG